MAVKHIELYPPVEVSSNASIWDILNAFEQGLNLNTKVQKLPIGSHKISLTNEKKYRTEVTVLEDGTGLLRTLPTAFDAELKIGQINSDASIEFLTRRGGAVTPIDAQSPLIFLSTDLTIGQLERRLLCGALKYEDLEEARSDSFTLTQARQPVTI